MRRYSFAIAIVAIVATSAVGGQESAFITDQGDSAPRKPTLATFEPGAVTVVSDDNSVASSTQGPEGNASNDANTLPSPPAQQTIESTTLQRPFHPVCSCDCTVPCLDQWCVWDVIRCDECWCNVTPCECAHGQCRLTESGCWVCNDGYCDVWGPPVYQANGALRFGYWSIANSGSQQKTGEYQDLSSSPFWDVDTITSDGVRTWDIILSGLDQETNDARIHYYGPEGKAIVDFQRFIHRLDHDPIQGYDLPPGQSPPATPAGNVIADDLNVGDDYAIRVSELDSKFQGNLTDNVKWKMNVWSMRKFGERQANATAHCFNVNAPAPPGATGNTCHVLSQRQTIDWTTVEVQPGVEARFENVGVEYTHTIRSFGTDDQTADRMYTRFNFSPASGTLGPPYEFSLVPESSTNIDRVKLTAALTDENQFYANLYHGETRNEFRDLERTYNGYDLRLINTSINDTTLTGYASRYADDTSNPTFFLDAPPYAPSNGYDEQSFRQPINYTRSRAGIKSGWQPWGDRDSRCTNYGLFEGTTIATGYEYYLLERENATYETALGTFTQPNTKTNQVEFGPSTRWSRSFETFCRYKVRFVEDPLIGVREHNGAFNTNQPEQLHITDVGCTWSPTSNFMTTSQVSIVNSWNDSQYADFVENNYPMSFTAWYAPTSRWSFTGGYAYYSNWIDQDITLGFTVPDVPPPPVVTETTRWSYAGENHLISFSAHYAWNDNVQLMGGYEYDRGTNTFVVPPSPAGADWSLLPSLSDVIVETQRLTAGIDYQPMRNTDLYFRYIFFDYNDISSNLYSGTSNMFLAGATRTW